MKKPIIAALLCVCAGSSTMAQNYRNSRYYNPDTGRMEYDVNRHNGHSSWGDDDSYFGLRIGPSFSTVNSDDAYLDGGSTKTGLNIGVVWGSQITDRAPLFIETGLYYTEKGGKGKGGNNDGKFTYSLNYLEVPLLFKYRHSVDDHFRVEPFFGGYFAAGVGGKIKNFGAREAYSSFSSHNSESFQRWDGGLKFGIGASYDMFYMELAYDLGLSNICHDYFDTSHNRALQLNFGVNF